MFNRLREFLEGIELTDGEWALLKSVYITACLAAGWYLAAWTFG